MESLQEKSWHKDPQSKNEVFGWRRNSTTHSCPTWWDTGGPGPESPHSAWKLHVLQTNPSTIKFNRRWIKWPAASMSSLWVQFDKDVNQILETTVKADGKLQSMTTIIASMGAKQFGEEEKSTRTPYSKNYREVRFHNIRQETRALRSQFQDAGKSKHTGLAQLMCILRKKIRVLHRAEGHRKGSKMCCYYSWSP